MSFIHTLKTFEKKVANMRKLIKKVTLSASVFAFSALLSTASNAYSNMNIECSSQINGSMSFSNAELTVFTETDQEVVFKESGKIYINNQLQNLNDEQTELSRQYYNSISATIPDVIDITVDALRITKTALSEVFIGLLGEESSIPPMISNKFDDLIQSIESHVYQNPEMITFDSQYFENELGIDQDIEQEVMQMKEEIMSKAMGEIMVMIGKSMMSGNGDVSNFEERMTNLGSEIEKNVDTLAERLEEKANILCDKFHSIDNIETELQKIPNLKHVNLVEMDLNKA